MSNELATIQNPYGAPAPMAPNHSTAVAVAREAQEVQAMVFMAKQFPRDERAAMDRILVACTRPTLASSAVYQYSRGGTDVSGPSIRLAEEMAKAWGNLDYGYRVTTATEKESTVDAFCWDIETNTRKRVGFTVPHVRHTKKGDYLLTDPRDIYEMVANQASRRVRECILRSLPSDVVKAAVDQCNKTQEAEFSNDGKSVAERMTGMVNSFAEMGVTKKMLEAYIGRNLDSVSPALFVKLKNVYRSIRDGIATVEDHFDAAMERVAEKENKRAKRAAAVEFIKAPAGGETAQPESPSDELLPQPQAMADNKGAAAKVVPIPGL